MILRHASIWLPYVYAAALVLHAIVLLLALWVAVAALFYGGANAAPDTLFFALVMMVPVLAAGFPSAVALLSWHLCRRKGTRPSPPHMVLTTGLALLVLGVIAVEFMS